ncbi:MAG: hypothetical protein K8R77_01375 [Anaerolineaceae bacterium]|nr:hypothetical protein [Anaerolineaceae bacterium]
MKKQSYLIILAVLVFLTMACSLGAVTDAITGNKAPEAEPEVAMPTSEISGVGEMEVELTPTPKLKDVTDDYLDEFNILTEDWSGPITMTSQAQPGKEQTKISYEDSKLIFGLYDYETYVYQFNQRPADPDVLLELKYQAGGAHENGIALICRAKPDQSEWYEFRVSSTGQYAIYYYDAALRDDYKNPYKELAKGVSAAIRPTRENIMRVMCNGTALVLEVNGEEVKTVQDSTLTEGGLVGVGAMSYNNLPVNIMMDYFGLFKP